MIAIIDYDAGNIRSVENALIALGEEVVITRDPEILLQAEKVILPGVGSFWGCNGKIRCLRTGRCDPSDRGEENSVSWHLPGTAAFV